MYLDNTATIDIGQALDGEWAPPELMDKPSRRLLAAARVAFYAHRDRGWAMCSSGNVARGEGLRGLGREWLDTHILEVEPTDATPALEAQFAAAGIDSPDSWHCAVAASHPYIGSFVTNDKKVLQRAPLVDIGRELGFVTIEEAELLLEITEGEQPPVAPASSNPLAAHDRWWIPLG